MIFKTIKPLLFSISMSLIVSCSGQSKKIETKEDVKSFIIKVNDYWQSNHTKQGNAFWDNAAYHTGNIAAYNVTGLDRYLDYSREWAEKNDWKGAKSKIKEDWKYSYGETNDYVLFGDWQICFQTYIDLFNISGAKDSNMIARAIEVMEYQMNTDSSNYWWWADGLYMVMPVMTKLYLVTGNYQYLEKLSEYFNYARNLMYDEESHLLYRDAKYIFPDHKTLDGKKDFWSRGNGWVIAGLAKILQEMPDDYNKKEDFVTIFKEMAYAVKNSQQAEGYWTRSLLDPEQSPGPETSGTAFFTYGLLWGINHGILDKQEFYPVIELSWNYLATRAINKHGRVGYVQPIGERAIPGQVVNKKSTSNFGVGAVLLAASEMYRFLDPGVTEN